MVRIALITAEGLRAMHGQLLFAMRATATRIAALSDGTRGFFFGSPRPRYAEWRVAPFGVFKIVQCAGASWKNFPNFLVD